ncbi:hypothetical protein ZIOFF_057586 [Zingiber officinale]|uniref:Phosphomannose isomerase type I catalytic domain-containing protein n=1 Tax=Zingiber officinale TaxID=94328 RepID=A0A8J5F8M4_ZINOF|nr:hypothetical protein ZIOFF_057586 [Zingiber officinale]
MRPSVYKDPNHKPKMVIALTEFKALCGFVSMEELKDVLSVPEITELVGNDEASKIIWTRELNGYMNAKAVMQSAFIKLILGGYQRKNNWHYFWRSNIKLMLVFWHFFFNYVKLSPDNVVRAGLTPKYIDIQTLCSMLTYKQVNSAVQFVLPVSKLP